MGAQSQDRQRQSCSTISPSCMSPYSSLVYPPLPKPTSKLELEEPSLVSVLAPVDKLTSMEQLVMLVMLVMLYTRLVMVSTLVMATRLVTESILTPELGP